MKRSIPPPTKAESDRWGLFRDYGCIVCRRKRKVREPHEVHHLKAGGRNISHWHTIPLCAYHHRGVRYAGTSDRDMVTLLGHARHYHGKPLFEKDHGTEADLWTSFQVEHDLEIWWPQSKIVPRRLNASAA